MLEQRRKLLDELPENKDKPQFVHAELRFVIILILDKMAYSHFIVP